jgi:hypothetical protein
VLKRFERPRSVCLRFKQRGPGAFNERERKRVRKSEVRERQRKGERDTTERERDR